MDPSVFPEQRWQAFQNLAPVADLLRPLPQLRLLAVWPTSAYWQDCAEALGIWEKLPERLRFVPQKKLGQRAKRRHKNRTSYESAIVESKEIPTRDANLHDFLNALIWMLYPLSKWTLHQQTFLAQKDRDEGVIRTRLADRMTCFDEGGVVLELPPGHSYEAVSTLLCGRDDAAKEKFCRAHPESFSFFGHGMLEVLFTTQPSVYASCCILPPSAYEMSRDQRLAQELACPVAHGTVDVLWLLDR